MKKILLILTTILTSVSAVWAQSVPTFTATNPESLADGWYQIKWITTNGASDYTDADVDGKFVTNYPGDITVNNKNYSLFLGNAPATLNEHAKTFVYLEGRVSDDTAGSHGNLRSANGHYITRTGESSTTKPDVNYIIYVSKGSYPDNSTITSSTSAGSRISLEPQGKNATPYIGQTNSTEKFPMVQFSPVNLSSIGLQAWTVNIEGAKGTETVSYNGDGTHYGISTVYNNGTFFFAQGVTPEASDFTVSEYACYTSAITINEGNKTITVTYTQDNIPSGYNTYIGETTVDETKWKTQSNWQLKEGATWKVGPGYTGSDMWQPIYLKGVTATGINIEGWDFCANLVKSSLTANTNKIQGTWTIDVADDSELTLTMTSSTSHTDDGTHTFNINGSMTINARPNRFNGTQTSTNQINLGTTGQFTLNCIDQSSLTIGSNASFTINATINDPANDKTIYSRTLAKFTNVTLNNLTVNINGTDGWTQVYSEEALTTTPGKFYYIEENSAGVKLYTYKTQIYNVAANTETLSQISNYESYLFFNVPETSTLIIDVDDFDLTKITGSGTINLTANTTLSEGQSITAKLSGSGKITLNYFPTAETHPTFNDNWTGSIEFADDNTSRVLDPILNAWGKTNSTIDLNNAKGHFNAGASVVPTINILSGKTLTIDNGYSNNNYPTLDKVTGSGDLALTFHPYSDEQVFNLTINNLIGFKGTLNGQYRPVIVKNFVLAGIPEQETPTDGNLLFKTLGTVNFSKTNDNSKIIINNEDKTELYAWENKSGGAGNGYYVSEYAPTKISKALTLVQPYNEGNYLGTSIGKYTISLGSTTYTDYVSFYNTVVDMQTISAWEGKTVSVAINQPTTGYYRLKSKYNDAGSDYYLSCQNTNSNNNAQQTTSTDEKNIFYIEVGNENSTIKSYSTGYYFGDHTRANYTVATNTPAKWTFCEGVNKGSYTLTSNIEEYTEQNLNGQILYGWSGASSKSYADRNSAVDNDGHTDWILIPVAKEDLPVIPAPGVTDVSRPVLLGNITSASDVTNNITASAKFVDLSQATIGTGTSIDDIKAEVAKINPNAIIIAPEGTSVEGETSNVLVPTGNASEYTCDNLQLNDEVIAQFATNKTIFTDTKVTYTRNSSASVWGTICLPYATSTQGDISYYRLVESSTSNLRFEKISDANTTAYEPYLIKKEAGAGLSVSAEGQEFNIGISGPQNGSSHNNYKLQGVLVNTSVIDGTNYTSAKAGYDVATPDPNAYYFDAANNTFRKLNGRFNLKAFRAYLTATSANARENIGIDIFDNDQPTGISFVESEDGKTVDVIFDLNGRRLQNAKKGINIINGKKVIK